MIGIFHCESSQQKSILFTQGKWIFHQDADDFLHVYVIFVPFFVGVLMFKGKDIVVEVRLDAFWWYIFFNKFVF